MADFINMGGYAVYVWGSYSAAGIVLAGNVWLAIRRARMIQRELRNLAQLKRSERP